MKCEFTRVWDTFTEAMTAAWTAANIEFETTWEARQMEIYKLDILLAESWRLSSSHKESWTLNNRPARHQPVRNNHFFFAIKEMKPTVEYKNAMVSNGFQVGVYGVLVFWRTGHPNNYPPGIYCSIKATQLVVTSLHLELFRHILHTTRRLWKTRIGGEAILGCSLLFHDWVPIPGIAKRRAGRGCKIEDSSVERLEQRESVECRRLSYPLLSIELHVVELCDWPQEKIWGMGGETELITGTCEYSLMIVHVMVPEVRKTASNVLTPTWEFS